MKNITKLHGITFKTCTNRDGVRATAVMLWSVVASLSGRSTVIAGKWASETTSCGLRVYN